MCKITPRKKDNRWVKRVIHLVAMVALIAAYVAGNMQNRTATTKILEEKIPGKSIVKIKSSPEAYEIRDSSDHQVIGWIIVSEYQGWGGPLVAGTLINQNALVERVIILNHRETPAFYQSLISQNYFNQFKGKPLQDAYQIENDIDGVSGATISSRAISNAVREGVHQWAKDYFSLEIAEQSKNIRIGTNEFILIVLYTVILISFFKKYWKIRYATMIFGLFFLGFYLGMPISVSAFGALALGYLPSISGFLFWWLLVFGAILMAVMTGKNLYCTWVCPFGGMQEFIHIIGGVKIRVSQTIAWVAGKIVYLLFWLSFMIMFLSRNPALGTFEPFTVLFSFKGFGIQWYLVTIALAGSFIIPRFWCRFFCPVGLVLKKLTRAKRRAMELIGFSTKQNSKKRLYDKKAFQ